jgi:hypothetical protein
VIPLVLENIVNLVGDIEYLNYSGQNQCNKADKFNVVTPTKSPQEFISTRIYLQKKRSPQEEFSTPRLVSTTRLTLD